MEVLAGTKRLAKVQETGREYPSFLLDTFGQKKVTLTQRKRCRAPETVIQPTKKPCVMQEEPLVTLNEYLRASTCLRTWGTIQELALQLGDYLAIWAIECTGSFDIRQYGSHSLKQLSTHLGPVVAKSGLEAVVEAHSHI
jgi:hypothetical protein